MLHKIHRIILYSSFFIIDLQLKAQHEFIVTVNTNTGALLKIDSLPGVRYLMGGSAFNQTTKEYIVQGTYEPGQAPVYLYTINVTTGQIVSSPLLPNPNAFVSMLFSRTTGVLYGITFQNNKYNLSTINKSSGTFTILYDIPGLSTITDIAIDEVNQWLYVWGVDNNPNYAILTIDLLTGNVLSHKSTSSLSELQFDNIRRKLYALTSRAGPTPGSPSIFSFCSVDPSTGNVIVISDLPNISGCLCNDHGTYNEVENKYLFVGVEQTNQGILYALDVNTGNIATRVPIDIWNRPDRNNLIFFRHDNLSGKTYALLWEAFTIPPSPIDSSCYLKEKTKIYQNPFSLLVIEKSPTRCKPVLNLYNTIGQLIMRNIRVNNGRTEIQLSHLSAGIYYYEFIAENKSVFSGKVFKY